MLRLLKTLLIWIMIAALPLQGMAAAIKASCGPAHHLDGPATAQAHPHAPGVHSAHTHQHGGDGLHHDFALHPDEASSADSPALAHGAGDSSYCSACAACCVGALAPPSVVFLPALHDRSEGVLVPPPRIATGFIPGGLERPPRNLSL